jgi:hypothetical protein
MMKDLLEASGNILGYGLTGLCLLLMILSYMTLNKVISTGNTSRSVISLVKFYFALTLICLIIVGVFSLWLAPRNTELQTEVIEKKAQISQTTDTLKVLKSVIQISNAASEGAKMNEKDIKQQTDTLKKYIGKVYPATEQKVLLENIADLRTSISTMTPEKKSDSVRQNTAVKKNLLQIQRHLLIRPRGEQ